ncbi:MAG: stage 0 sporulation family protein [Clostridia bacterium]|nr:stage 0 sporulation family protein [Clostridia bacterium]
MTCVIGVRFKEVGKVYYFDPNGIELKLGDDVIVETSRGVECGKVAMANRELSDDKVTSPLKKLIRKATDEDLKKVEENHKKEQRAFGICEQKIRQHGLQMKLVNVEYTFDNNKILFYFTADGRVDFRELVKDLAYVFKTRIELRQIGVRDEAKMLGGLGICGRPFCCNTFLGEFQPVSIKMAKEQGMSLNPVKISGTCGRLMCCLKYEQDVYTSLLKITPKIGAIVDTPDGKGNVIDVNLLTGVLTVSLHKAPDAAAHTYNVSEVRIIKDGQIKLDKDEIARLKKLEKD